MWDRNRRREVRGGGVSQLTCPEKRKIEYRGRGGGGTLKRRK